MSYKLKIPTYTETDFAEAPWYAVELELWEAIQKALEPSSDLTSIAESINALFPTNRRAGLSPAEKEEPISFLLELWGFVTQAASQIPAANRTAHDRLFGLVSALQALPYPVEIKLGEDPGAGTGMLWSDLPALDPAIWDASHQYLGSNLHAFIARVSGAGFGNFWQLALVSLNDALEKEPAVASRPAAYSTNGRPWKEEEIPGAVAWIEHAGAKLYAKSEEGALRDTGYGVGGYWEGEKGFSKGRWDYWKQRFGEVAEDERFGQETRASAKKVQELFSSFEV